MQKTKDKTSGLNRIYEVGNVLALNLTLSPKEREPPLAALEKSLASECFASARRLLPLLGGEGQGALPLN